MISFSVNLLCLILWTLLDYASLAKNSHYPWSSFRGAGQQHERGKVMSRRRYTPEQIIRKLREAEVLISQGMTTPEAARQVGVVEQTYYRWRKEYGGMRIDQAKRLKVLVNELIRP